jgi:anti-anti-sigma factor
MTRTETPFASVLRRAVLPRPARAGIPTVVRLDGDYDLSTVGCLWETLAQAMTHDDADIVLDLSRVEFMDAAAVAVIVQAGNRLRRRSRSLRVQCPSSRARRFPDLCGLAGQVEAGAGEITAAATLSAPDADLEAARQATNEARRRGP